MSTVNFLIILILNQLRVGLYLKQKILYISDK